MYFSKGRELLDWTVYLTSPNQSFLIYKPLNMFFFHFICDGGKIISSIKKFQILFNWFKYWSYVSNRCPWNGPGKEQYQLPKAYVLKPEELNPYHWQKKNTSWEGIFVYSIYIYIYCTLVPNTHVTTKILHVR